MIKENLINFLNDDKKGFLTYFSPDEKSELQGLVEISTSEDLMLHGKIKKLLSNIHYSNIDFLTYTDRYRNRYLYSWIINKSDDLEIVEFEKVKSSTGPYCLTITGTYGQVHEEKINIGIRPVIYIKTNSLNIANNTSFKIGDVIEFGYIINSSNLLCHIEWILIDKIDQYKDVSEGTALLKLISKLIIYPKCNTHTEFSIEHIYCDCGRSLKLIEFNNPIIDGSLYECACGNLYLNPNDDKKKLINVKGTLEDRKNNISITNTILSPLPILFIILLFFLISAICILFIR